MTEKKISLFSFLEGEIKIKNVTFLENASAVSDEKIIWYEHKKLDYLLQIFWKTIEKN